MYPYAETTQGHKDSLDPDAFFLQDHITGGRLARWGHANSDNGSEAGTPSPVSHLEGTESSQTRRWSGQDSNPGHLGQRRATIGCGR